MATLNTVTVVATVVIVFDTAAPSSAVAFEGTLGPLDNYVPGGALAGTVFDGVMPTLFGATDAFTGIAFRPDNFAHFTEGPTPSSLFLFLAASSHASEPGSKRGS
jgi:hypothetical protein